MNPHCRHPDARFDAPRSPSAEADRLLTAESLDDFLAVVDRYQQRVAAVVGRFLDDQRDVEEAVQDTFVQVWRHRDSFRNDAAVFTWVYRIAVNTALMRLRRHHPPTVEIDQAMQETVSAIALAHDPMEQHAELLDERRRVRSALADLPEHYRMVVLLRDVDGRSTAEAAQLLGISVGAAKAQLHRARALLRVSLGL